MAPRKPKQERIPGTERKNRNEDIERAAARYVEVRDERMEMTERESEAQTDLVAAMERGKVTTYRCDESDLIVELSELKKAKVRKVKDPNEDRAEAAE